MHARISVTMFVLFAAVSMLAAAEPAFVPVRFKAYIGGFLDGGNEVEWHDGVLTHTTFEGGRRNVKQSTVKPTPAQWLEFRKALDELKLWRWRKVYSSKGVSDGTQWSLDLAYADQTVNCQGNNNYPDAAGQPTDQLQPSGAFERYLKAVQKLTGGKSFQ